jgi:hypothetical protein
MSGGLRNTILLSVLGVLALLVVLDYATRSGGAPAGDGVASARSLYLERAGQRRMLDAVVESEPRWSGLLDSLETQAGEARARSIEAVSAELAASRLSDMVSRTMSDLDLTPGSTSTTPARGGGEDAPFRVIGLAIQFDVQQPETLHRLIDRLENAADVAVNIDRLTIYGPGLSMRTGLRVEMSISALAYLTRPSLTGSSSTRPGDST